MPHSLAVSCCRLQSEIGLVTLSWNDQGLLRSVDLSGVLGRDSESSASGLVIPGNLAVLIGKLQMYLKQGEPLTGVNFDWFDRQGWSEFQSDVYRATLEIPHGETRTYAWVARRVGKGMATRAVGQALRKNPIPIVIPCHRVVSSEALGGFMGIVDPNLPETRLKRHLIEIEKDFLNPVFPFLAEGWSSQWDVPSAMAG